MLCAAPSSEYTISDDYSAGAAGSSTPKGSPRAWLLPFSHLEMVSLWTRNALFIRTVEEVVLGTVIFG